MSHYFQEETKDLVASSASADLMSVVWIQPSLALGIAGSKVELAPSVSDGAFLRGNRRLADLVKHEPTAAPETWCCSYGAIA